MLSLRSLTGERGAPFASTGLSTRVYALRMARVNISIPDEIYRQAKDAGLNISRLARKAILQELSDREKIAAVYDYLDELEAELGPATAEERAQARDWADGIYGPREGRQSA